MNIILAYKTKFETFSFRKRGLTVNQIVGQLEEEDTACDVLVWPSWNDFNSDSDSESEENVLPKDPNHLGAGILSQISEVIVYDRDEELPDLIDVNPAGEVVDVVEDETAGEPRKRTRRQTRQQGATGGEAEGATGGEAEVATGGEEDEEEEEEDNGRGEPSKLNRVHNKDRIWKTKKPMMFGMSVPQFTPPPFKILPDDVNTPYDFHKLFLDDEFVNHLVHVSKLYSTRKYRSEVQQKLSNNNIRVSIAIMHMTGYLTPANRNMYWEQREDTQNQFVRKAMSKNMFSDIIRNTYFVDRVDPDPEDRFWKVRPLFNQLNKTAKKWVTQPETVSVDEAIIKYFGPHPLKQYMKGKPHRFGYKVCYIYLFHCTVYSTVFCNFFLFVYCHVKVTKK